MKTNYYTLNNILKQDALYNMIIGERSNGKTYAVLKYCLEKYFQNSEQAAVIRRWREDFKGKRALEMFQGLIANDEISKATNGMYNTVIYKSGRYYLRKYTANEDYTAEHPFMLTYALTEMEHDKGGSNPNITTVFFDEFLTRGSYLPDEFVIFMNTLSTIIRDRDNVKIFMCANTVNKYCPYFKEMGLFNITNKMKPGTIEVYKLDKLKIAVEYSDKKSAAKPSDVYFAFNNPRLKMITEGSWEIDLYPHLPYKYRPKNVLLTFYIDFDSQLLECEIIGVDSDVFIFIHQKTTPLKELETDLIYSTSYSPKPNVRRKITKPILNIEKKIYTLFATDKVFYQDNETGEIVRNYLEWCKTN